MSVGKGSLVGAYQVERLLGRGGMGEVYLARHRVLDRAVALKVLAPALGDDAQFRDRFLAESRLAASLDHPNVVTIYEAGDADGRLYLAMRYVDGDDLDEVLKREGRIAPDRALRLLRGVASALDVAHARGLVHRDVKPGNILIGDPGTPSEHPYLADFGLVKRLDSNVNLTRTGQFIGSAGHVAPEQIEGGAVDRRADVYSLGAVAFHALTGQTPYARVSEVATLWAHVNAPVPVLSEVRPELAVADIALARAMAKDPADRQPSAGRFVEELAAALSGGPVVARPAVPGEPASARSAAFVGGPPVAPVAGRTRGRLRSPGGTSMGVLAAGVLVVVTLGAALTIGSPPTTLGPGSSGVNPSSGAPSGGGPSDAQPSVVLLVLPTSPTDGFQLASGELQPGVRYEMAVTRPRTRFTIPGPGWVADRDYTDGFNLGKMAEAPAENSIPSYFTMAFPQVVYKGPCTDSPLEVIVPPEPSTVMAYLTGHATVDATPPEPLNFGTYSGLSTVITIPAPPPAGTCPLPEGLESPSPMAYRFMQRTYLFRLAEDVFHISPGEVIKVVAVKVDGQLLLLMYGTTEEALWGDFVPEGELLLKSIEFVP